MVSYKNTQFFHKYIYKLFLQQNKLNGKNTRNPEIVTPIPYHGSSITSCVQDSVLRNTKCRFTVFAPTVQSLGGLLIL